jgi:hypothetical protein
MGKHMMRKDILQDPFPDLGFSKAFCEQSKRMGVTSLSEVADLGPAQLLQRQDFSYSWLAELAAFLNKNKLGDILQPIPGSTGG